MATRRDTMLQDRLGPALAEVEARVLAACCGTLPSENAAVAAARHHFAAGGGRVRARICLEVSFGLGLPEVDALCMAACCELLHNASLVQDDLLDRTALRRGQASVWALWGETVAVCAGDLMLAGAFAELAGVAQPRVLPALLRHAHVRTREVILGQAAEKSGPAPRTLDAYERMAAGKSASLLALAVELPLLMAAGGSDGELGDAFAGAAGVLSPGLPGADLPRAYRAASAFAVAYQIADDLDDVEQDRVEGAPNAVSLFEAGGMTRVEARSAAVARACALLAEAEALAAVLPHGCAQAFAEPSAKLLGVLSRDACALDGLSAEPLSPAA